jgi:hypothetical protein
MIICSGEYLLLAILPPNQQAFELNPNVVNGSVNGGQANRTLYKVRWEYSRGLIQVTFFNNLLV